MNNEWQEFFEKFGTLLNEYHFMISDFVLGKAKDDETKIVSFQSDGKRVYPVYSVSDKMN